MKLKNILVVYTKHRNKEQKSTLSYIIKVLKKHKISHIVKDRDILKKSYFKNKDLIISIGGDGTFLRASQFIKNQTIFGVNSDPRHKEGFFTYANKTNFEKKLINITKGKFKIKKLLRLQATLNNKKLKTLALNEFYIGPKKSYHASKYKIQFKKTIERQKSSGVLITTPAGSYAWAKACCDKTMPLESENFQFIVREPYEAELFSNYKLKHKILKKNQEVTIYSEMLDGILIADSVGKEFSFKDKSKVTIKASKIKLNSIVPK